MEIEPADYTPDLTTETVHWRHHIQLFLSTFFCLFFFTGTSSYAQTSAVNHQLPEFTARYAITKFDIKLASATYSLKYSDTGYVMTQYTSLYGMAALFRDDTVSATSVVDKVDGQLRLKSFNYIQTGKEKDRDEKLNFSYQNSSKGSNDEPVTHITGVSRNKAIDIHTRGTVWDVLSFQIPLMLEANKATHQYPYMAVLGGELDEYTFVLSGEKSYEFAGKSYQLLNMVRTDKAKNRALHIWLAPELHNLPVIIENYRDGKLHSRMQLERVQFNRKKPIEETEEIDFDE